MEFSMLLEIFILHICREITYIFNWYILLNPWDKIVRKPQDETSNWKDHVKLRQSKSYTAENERDVIKTDVTSCWQYKCQKHACYFRANLIGGCAWSTVIEAGSNLCHDTLCHHYFKFHWVILIEAEIWVTNKWGKFSQLLISCFYD